MPTEGQTAVGPNGQRAVFRGGQWVTIPAPAQGGVFRDPYRASEERRREGDQAMEAERLALERQRVALAERQAALDAQKVTTEQSEKADKVQARDLSSLASTDNTLSILRNVREIIRSGENVAGWDGLLASLPGTTARKVRNDLDTIRANLTFEELQKMRANSQTGAAVGNVSDTDMRLLGSTVANLDNLQDASSLLEALDRIERHYARFSAAINGIDPETEEGFAEIERAYGKGALTLGDPLSRLPSEDDGSPLTPDQQRMLQAFYDNNPNFTADQLAAFTRSVGIPEIANIDEIIAARELGSGVAPAARAQFDGAGWQGNLPQGMSGVNEGIAAVLGLPVDAFTGAVNLVGSGTNWLNETLGGDARANIPAIENPVGGSGWFGDLMSDSGMIGPDAQSDDGAFWRRVGNSAGASLVPGFGAARTPGNVAAALLSGTAGGYGAATAQQVFPDNPAAEIAGELLGSFAGGGVPVAAASMGARNAARNAVPTTDELKAFAGTLYDQAETRGIVADAAATQQLADDITQIARDEALISARGNVSEQYSKLAPVLRTLQDEAGQVITPKRIQVLRETLADAAYSTEGKERRIATQMLRAFDEATVPLAPELAEARDISSRYLQAAPIDEAIALAGSREGQFSQSGWDNALRTDFANLMRSEIRGSENFRPEVVEAIENVAVPSGTRAAARWAGRLSPTGTGGLFLGGLPGGVSLYAGEPVLGALLSGGIYGVGAGGRYVAGRLAQQEAQDAALMARSGGTLQLPGLADTETADTVAAALAGQAVPYTTPEEQDAFIAQLLAEGQFTP